MTLPFKTSMMLWVVFLFFMALPLHADLADSLFDPQLPLYDRDPPLFSVPMDAYEVFSDDPSSGYPHGQGFSFEDASFMSPYIIENI